jgi:hypothetical protein
MNFFSIIFKYSAPASQETYRIYIIKTDCLMILTEQAATYSENHTKELNTL